MKKKILGFIIFLIIIFAVSFFSTILLFPLNEKIDLPNIKAKEVLYIDEIKTDKLSFRSAIAEALQVPLRLKWYNIYFENDSILEANNCIGIDPGSPYLDVHFSEGNPDRFVKSTLEKPFGEEVSQVRRVNAGERGFFVYKGDEGFSYGITHGWGGKCPKNEDMLHAASINYTIYAMPNKTAWWAKFFVLFIIWLNVGELLKSQFK